MMPKLYQICRFFKLTFLFVLPVAVAISFFTFYGHYNYPHIPRDAIDKELYKKVIPSVLKKGKPSCTYDHVLYSKNTINTWDVLKKYNDFNAEGIENGSYSPAHCNPLFSAEILVTYRRRPEQLEIFLSYMHIFLRKQDIHYRIYLIEQQHKNPFNRGLLSNIGARQAIADKFPCLIFHDVDLLPLDDSNLYACTKQPRHLSASIDKFRFVLVYEWLVGGVLAMRSDHFEQVDGFSNRFQNWGGEDDDFYMRMTEYNLKILRFPREMSHYTMLYHPQAVPNPQATKLLVANRYDTQSARAADGMRAARGFVRVKTHRLLTLIAVST